MVASQSQTKSLKILKKITALEKSVKEMAEKIKHLEDELAKNKKSTANPKNKICCEECDYRCEKVLH